MNEPSLSEATQYLQHRAEHLWRRGRRHVLATTSWARRQPRARLLTLALAALAATGAVWLVLQLLLWVLSTLAGGEQAPPPPAVPHHQPPPHWAVELNRVALWRQLAGTVQHYAAEHAPAAGMPPWLLLALWCGAGAALLLASWFAPTRGRVAAITWAGWVAATAWVVWTQTPGGDPVPAAVTAALGVTAAVVPLAAPVVLAVVVLGLIPPII